LITYLHFSVPGDEGQLRRNTASAPVWNCTL